MRIAGVGLFIFSLGLSFCWIKSTKKTSGQLSSQTFMNAGMDNVSPIVIELFSSEGCSSCPPADKLMEDLVKTAESKSAPVYLLTFHVNYWDYLGWKDTLASPEFTQRQYEYRSMFRLSSVYTPQAVINGKQETVGSNRQKITELISSFSAAQSQATITCMAKQEGTHSEKVNYEVTGNFKDCYINYALVLKKVTNKILRGENSGKNLTHVNVVRSFEQTILPSSGKGIKTMQNIPSNPEDYRLIVLVQKKNTMEIIAACSMKL